MMISSDTENRVHQVVRVVAATAVLCVLIWGLMPLRAELSEAEQFVSGGDVPQSLETESLVVSADVFDLTLWYSPPPAVQKTVTKSRPDERMSFELLAISASRDISGNRQQYSVIYDTKDDSIHTLLLGQSIRGYIVAEIDLDSVMMTAGAKTITLSLDAEDAG